MTDLGNPQQLALSLLSPGHDAAVLTVVLSGRVTTEDVGRLDRRVEVLLEEWLPRLLVCDVAALVDPDLATVDALARLRLTANRRGCDVTLRGVPAELHRLLDLAGLRGVLVVPPTSGGGMLRQPEEGEQPRGVEEGVDPGDPAG